MPRNHQTPLVLLTCIDALRYDCLNWQPEQPYFEKFGMPRRLETPTLDRIANESVRFQRAVSHAGYTPPSLATALTGTYTRAHGVVDFQNTTCREEVTNLAQHFKKLGWRTYCACGPDFLANLGLTRGFDHVHPDEAALLAALENDPPEPTFAFVHFNDVHHPYLFSHWNHPRCDNTAFHFMMQVVFGVWVDEAARQFVDAEGNRVGFEKWDQIVASKIPQEAMAPRLSNLFRAYTLGIQQFDQRRLASFVDRIEAAGWWEQAVFALFADHGEIVSPRVPWSMGHGKYLNEQLLRIPLTIKAPGLEPRDVRTLVGLVDLAPTILQLAGCTQNNQQPDRQIDGRSLVPTIHTGEPAQADYYQESWSVLVAEEKRQPVLYQRAIRTQDDVRYVFTGDMVETSEFANLTEDEFLRYAIERILGEIAYPQTCEQVRAHLRKGLSREQLLAGLSGNVARFARFNVAEDPFEENGIGLNPQHPLWHEYLQMLKRMLELRGRPNPIAEHAGPLTEAQEAAMLQHLGELGYVE